jgi:predicted MFS family arabinose efflux permease
MPELSGKFTRYQKAVVAILAFLQFTIILDFMVISPLGAILMPALKILPSQFGIVVSAYAFSAGISGILAAGFADRYDRKKLLLFFYVGFLLGTLLCGIAQSFHFLLFARVVTGIFGGVIGSIVLAISTDLFPIAMRGRVMGFVQSAFAASQVLGLPAGLYFSNLWGWHAPFLLIVSLGALVGVLIFMILKPIDEHLKLQKNQNAVVHLLSTLSNKNYTLAYIATALLSTGGFMLMPFASAFSVHNLGVDMEHLPIVYLVTGLVALIAGPLIGRATDYYGKLTVFAFGCALSILMVLIYTHLDRTPLHLVILVNAVLFIGIFSRVIPSQALMSAIPAAAYRGSFMAVSASLQQMSGGLAAVIAGLVVVEGQDGRLLHFDTLGYIIVGTTTTTMVLMYFINQAVMRRCQV